MANPAVFTTIFQILWLGFGLCMDVQDVSIIHPLGIDVVTNGLLQWGRDKPKSFILSLKHEGSAIIISLLASISSINCPPRFLRGSA